MAEEEVASLLFDSWSLTLPDPPPRVMHDVEHQRQAIRSSMRTYERESFAGRQERRKAEINGLQSTIDILESEALQEFTFLCLPSPAMETYRLGAVTTFHQNSMGPFVAVMHVISERETAGDYMLLLDAILQQRARFFQPSAEDSRI